MWQLVAAGADRQARRLEGGVVVLMVSIQTVSCEPKCPGPALTLEQRDSLAAPLAEGRALSDVM